MADQSAPRCGAAHRDDQSPCTGALDAVLVRDTAGSETTGCVHHGAVLLASLYLGTVHPGPGAAGGEAIKAFKRAQKLLPFAFETAETGNDRPCARVGLHNCSGEWRNHDRDEGERR